jgi:predicted 3-demethylubiquinone-9 3-methyltransferase (glyoxalase superfamily)
MTTDQKITPFLWFANDAEAAVAFYLEVFGGKEISRFLYPEGVGGPGKPGSVCTIEFEIQGTRLTALNGGSDPAYTDALSLMFTCDDQSELDRIWAAIEANGGKPVACGWIQDRWGLRWQIVPRSMLALLASDDTAAKARGFAAMMTMVKLDGPALEAAAYGKAA